MLRTKRAEDSLKKVVDQLADKNKFLEKLSITDALTGLFNRRELVKLLKENI